MSRKYVVLGGAAAAGLGALAAALAAPLPSIRFTQEGWSKGLNRLNEPAAAAAVPFVTNAANLPYGSYFLDLDGDGLLDVFSINHGQAPHRSGLWLNGGGAFGQNLYTVAVSGWNLSQTGWIEQLPDLDSDGHADLYFLGWNATAAYCSNRGVSTQNGWTGPTFPCTPAPYLLSFADVNGDGRPDVESFDPSLSYDYYQEVTRNLPVVWRINNGSTDASTFGVVRDPFSLAATAEAGALLDLDKDGLPDRVFGTPAPAGSRGPYALGSLGTVVQLGQAGGAYVTVSSGLESVKDPIQKLEDINEDGCLDVGFDPTRYRQNPYWYLQNRDASGRCLATFHYVGRRSSELPYFPGFARYSIDLDNSGTMDKVVLVSSAYGDNEGFPAGVHVYLKQADGTYVEVSGHGIDLPETYYWMMQPGDWNNDGLMDLVGQGSLSQPGTDAGVALYTNQTATSNRWLKVKLPTVNGLIQRPGRIEVFEAGRVGDAAALVTPAQAVRSGRHWPTLTYHFGVGARSAVDVRVTFPDGSSVVQAGVATNQIVSVTPTANLPPVAVADVTPTAVSVGATVQLSGGRSTDPDGSVVTWRWDFGDGTTASGAQVSKAYATLGTFTVRLTVTDDRGASASATATVSVTDSTRPTALLSQATFTPQVADNVGVTSVQWFVDGSLRLTSTTPPFALTLDLTGLSAGSHVISARAFDSVGNSSDAASLTINK